MLIHHQKSLNDVFRMIDSESKGYITYYDIKEMVSEGNKRKGLEMASDIDLLGDIFNKRGQ